MIFFKSDKRKSDDKYAEYIKDLVKRAGETDRNLKIFGASSHKYKLNPVIPLSTVRDVERQYNIKLPEEYVFFLTKIGNGGAGPNYGIYPLERAVETTPYLKDYTLDEMISTPIFLDKSMTQEEWDKKIDIMEDMSDDEYDKYEKSIFSGQLEIGTGGCAACMTLMIRGNYYGEVVHTNLEHYMPIFTNMTFMQWYERFFEWIVKDYDIHLFDSINNLTEYEIVSMYNTRSDFDTRYNLLLGLLKYKHISDQTIDFLYSLDDIQLTDLTLHILLKSAGEKSLKFFEKLLSEKEYKTVAERCRLMPKEYRDRYYNSMLDILYKNDDINKKDILYFLKYCECLNPKDIMPYILDKNNPLNYRESALFVIMNCKELASCSKDFARLLLDDKDNITIIKDALYCIQKHNIPDLIPVYRRLQQKYKNCKEIQGYLNCVLNE